MLGLGFVKAKSRNTYTNLPRIHVCECVSPTLVGEENEIPFYKGVKTFSLQAHFEASRESLKGKAQRGQYGLVVDLDYYSTRYKPCAKKYYIFNTARTRS